MKHLIFLLTLVFMNSTMFSQDWPNLKRYEDQNDILMTKPIDSNRVVFMGNSITEGWSNISPEFFKNPSFINRGISGQTTPQMLIRFRQDVIDLKPRTVVILAGINDIAGNTGPSSLVMIKNNIASMVDLALANDIKVILCSVLPAEKFNWRPEIEPAQKVIDLNNILKNLAGEKGLTFVNYFDEMKNDSNGLKLEYGEDGVHPNLVGYKVMERILLEAMVTIK